MNLFNPTTFIYKNKQYYLYRHDTDVVTWNSVLTYYLMEASKLESKRLCTFSINNFDYTEGGYSQNHAFYEDIKVIDCLSTDDRIIATCNKLQKNMPSKVALVEIDVDNAIIRLIKDLTISEISGSQKNWVIFNYKDNYYILTHLFPEMKIYKLDIQNYIITPFIIIDTFSEIKDTHIVKNCNNTYTSLYLSACPNFIKIGDNFLIKCKARKNTEIYEYYYCLLETNGFREIPISNTHLPATPGIGKGAKLKFLNNKIEEGLKLYINSINMINGVLIECAGINDRGNRIEQLKININLIYFNNWNNFGDELSPFIFENLLNKDKYTISYNKPGLGLSLVMIGSYLSNAINNSYIYGSGIRTDPPIEKYNNYNSLNICSVRGPLTKSVLEKKGFTVPEIYGDPGLLLPLFYTPKIIPELSNKIGVIPHKTNYNKYTNIGKSSDYYLISPTENWRDVINKLASCKCIISSCLHGLISSDAYNKPNIWLDEYPLEEGDFKFKDYFMSQSREYIKITRIDDFDESQLYTKGNIIDLEKLRNAFPFT